MKFHRLLVALLAGALLVAACGDDDADTTAGDADDSISDDADLPADADEPNPAAGACLEGDPDCQDVGAAPPPGPVPGEEDPTVEQSDEPTDDAGPASDDYDARAEQLIGTPEDELPADVRISRRGDEAYAVTEDYVVGRATVELDLDAELDQYVVTTVVFETEDGPKTYGANA